MCQPREVIASKRCSSGGGATQLRQLRLAAACLGHAAGAGRQVQPEQRLAVAAHQHCLAAQLALHPVAGNSRHPGMGQRDEQAEPKASCSALPPGGGRRLLLSGGACC